MGAFRIEVCCASYNAQEDQSAEDEVFADRLGKEWHASLLDLRFIFFSVSFFLNQLSWNGILIDSFAEN